MTTAVILQASTPLSDLKIAALLSTAFGLAAAISVPLLIDHLPPEARELPLPLPVFCAVLAVQMSLVYGLAAWAGLRLARSRGLDPAPLLTAGWSTSAREQFLRRGAAAFAAGIGCGIALVTVVALIVRLVPGSLPQTLHPPSIGAALAASTAGSLGEEILYRLFLLSLLLRIFPDSRTGTWAAISISALAFGAGHAPAFVLLYGGVENVPPVSWVWLIGINGALGIAYAIGFLRAGIGCAILMHFGTDLVWHVATQLVAG